jgi:hypothetical protein
MRSKLLLLTAATAALGAALAIACGGGTNPAAPPSATPTTTTTTTTLRPPSAACNPSPPPLYGIHVKVHSNGDGYRRILDARPQVVNVDGYCGRTGQYEHAAFCFTRIEGEADMAACDQAAMGVSNTGRWGPTWYYQDQLCTSGSPGCTDHPDNQFLVIAKGQGLFGACAADSVPVSDLPSASGVRCGGCVLREGDTDCER